MIKYALLVTLEAKSGKIDEVEEFLKSALPLVETELNTITWYAFKMGANKFGIFNTFTNEEGRKMHLAGELAKALVEKGHELFASDPQIKQVDVIAKKQSPVNESYL